MKKINRNILILVLAISSLPSCNEEWLKPQPLSIFSPENIFVDKDGMEGILLVCRKNLRWEFCTDFNTSLCGENISSELFVSGSPGDKVTKDWFVQITPTNTSVKPLFDPYWNIWYDIIRNANVVISRIDVPKWGKRAGKK